MKKNIPLAMLMVAGMSVSAQFTPGNLAVYRYGNGDAPMTNGQRVPVFIDEYTASGSFVKTISVSRTTNGSNYGLEGLGLKGDGSFENEGYPVLSRDGSVLSIIGYNPDQTGQFVIGTINAAGDVSTNTSVVDTDLGLPAGTPRSAVVEGASVYFNSWSGGVRYKQLGTNALSTRVSTGLDAPRVLTIADTYFNDTNKGVKIFAPNAGAIIYNAVMPTASISFETKPNIPGTSLLIKAHQAAVIKSATNRTLLYVIDDKDGEPSLKKYRSNGAGVDWVFFGRIAIPANTKSIAAVYDSSTGVKIYMTSWGTAGENDSKLYSYTDNFTTTSEATEPSGAGDTKLLAGSIVEIATAPVNTIFRGVTMAPGTSILPVALTSFQAKKEGGIIKINWSTVSEKNSSHFDVLRSSDGQNFLKTGDEIKSVGNADSRTDYSFKDSNPFPGVNYYKLQQFDKDGKSELFGPVQVTTAIDKADFNIYASKTGNVLETDIYSAVKQSGKIKVLDMEGRVLIEQGLSLDKGSNKIILLGSNLKPGVQIAILNMQGEVVAKKFMW